MASIDKELVNKVESLEKNIARMKEGSSNLKQSSVASSYPACVGSKIKSQGRGRGLGIGKGQGPIRRQRGFI